MEQVSIFLFAAGSLIFLLIEGWFTGTPGLDDGPIQDDSAVTAQANAMPAQGWAPLAVYFSAYGSWSEAGQLARYEWQRMVYSHPLPPSPG